MRFRVWLEGVLLIAAKIEFNNDEAHSALYDAEKTAELFCGIVNKWSELGGWK